MALLNANTISPEERELQKKRNELTEIESELAQRELDLATLQAEINAFERQYLSVVGARYAELDEVRAHIAEARARLRPDDRRAREEAEETANRAQESAQEAASVSEEDAHSKFKPSNDLKKLYREMARLLHPDLATEPQERDRRHTFMVQLNLAFEKGDEERMRIILQEWEAGPQQTEAGGIGAELVRVIRKIAQAEERISAIGAQIESLLESEIYQLF
ncbi:MAG: hypothetical protein ACKVX9_24470, partial [Blastocatellia bacterium]